MPRISKFLLSLSLFAALGFLAACSEKSDDTDSSGDTTTVSLDDCTPDQLETFKDGTLTVATPPSGTGRSPRARCPCPWQARPQPCWPSPP